MLTRSGILLFKLLRFWQSRKLETAPGVFGQREKDPLKQWKLSPIDKASLDKWDDLPEAKEAMSFIPAHRRLRPGPSLKSDCRSAHRINLHEAFLVGLPYPTRII